MKSSNYDKKVLDSWYSIIKKKGKSKGRGFVAKNYK